MDRTVCGSVGSAPGKLTRRETLLFLGGVSAMAMSRGLVSCLSGEEGRKMGSQGEGFVRLTEKDGIWWFQEPKGSLFLSKGVNHVNFHGDFCPALGYSPYQRNVTAKYGSDETWAQETARRLKEWGFNTIGAWSSPSLFQHMHYTLILDLGASAGADWLKGAFPDVFSPEFVKAVESRAQKLCGPRAGDPLLIGYFTDNELRWGPDWRSQQHLLDDFLLLLPEGAAGKRALIDFFRGRYRTVEAFNESWGLTISDWDGLNRLTSLPRAQNDQVANNRDRDRMDFLREIAGHYFRVCHQAIKKADPNHLILGCRFAGGAPEPVIDAIYPYVDVVSFQWYGFEPPIRALRRIYEKTKRPVMLTEFSFKAMDSGLPNSRGAGQPVASQKDRADCFESFVKTLVREPYLVGYHWFQYSDQPEKGRFDGENSNYGLVKETDEPWQELTERMKRVNGEVDLIHRHSG